MERNNIIMILCSQDYPEYMLETTADKVENMNKSIKEAFEDWANDGTVPHIEVEGWSYNRLVDKFKMRPVAAFLALDWLIRDLEKASKSLKKGIK